MSISVHQNTNCHYGHNFQLKHFLTCACFVKLSVQGYTNCPHYHHFQLQHFRTCTCLITCVGVNHLIRASKFLSTCFFGMFLYRTTINIVTSGTTTTTSGLQYCIRPPASLICTENVLMLSYTSSSCLLQSITP